MANEIVYGDYVAFDQYADFEWEMEMIALNKINNEEEHSQINISRIKELFIEGNRRESGGFDFEWYSKLLAARKEHFMNLANSATKEEDSAYCLAQVEATSLVEQLAIACKNKYYIEDVAENV